MFNIRKFIMWYVYSCSTIVNYFSSRNYEIEKVYLEYVTDGSDRKSANYFWNNLDTYHNQYEYTTDVTTQYNQGKLRRILRRVPPNVINYWVIIKYKFNKTTYKKIFYRPSDDIEFPNKEKNAIISFSIPIKSAKLQFSNKNITKLIKRFAGPKNNFHETIIRVRDIVYIPNNNDKLIITNILNQSTTIDVDTGVLRYPLF